MSETYNKKVVLASALRAARAIRLRREAECVIWDSQNIIVRFFSTLGGMCRPDYQGKGQEELAERIAFKATFCIEQTVSLSDYEIDTLREFWGMERE